MQVPNVTLHFLAEELNQSIAGARITKIQAIGPQELKFKLLSASGSLELVMTPNAVFIASHRYPSTENIQYLVEFLKKHLEGKRIVKINQVNHDRILGIDFEHFSLVCELFAKGNFILLNSDGIIEATLRKEEWKDRTIAKGEKYKPPSSVFLLSNLTEKKFAELLSESEKKIVSALVSTLNLFGPLAEESVLQSGISKETIAKELSNAQIKKLILGINRFSFEKAKSFPVIFKTEPSVLLPFELPLVAAEKKAVFEKTESFSKALDDDYCGRFEKPVESQIVSKRVLQLEKSIVEQQKTKSELEQKAVENNLIGEAIFSNYSIVKELLLAAKSAKKNGFSSAVALEKFRLAAVQGSVNAQKVVALDFKKNRLIIEL